MNSVWHCLVLCLISSQERANKRKLYLIVNTKSTTKKQTSYKLIIYLKSKLNQVSVSVLLDWQLLCQVSKNVVLRPIIY